MVSDGQPSGKRLKEEDKKDEEGRAAAAADRAAVMWQDEDLVQEVMKHMDGFTLASASCVSRTWRHAADDESLWERICTYNWPHHPLHSSPSNFTGPSPSPSPPPILSRNLQLKRVVQGLGGFRRLFVTYLRPLLHKSLPPPSLLPTQAASTANWAPSTANLVALTAPNLPPNSAASTPKLAAKPTPRRCNHFQAWGRDEVHLSLSLYSIDCFSRLGKISSSPSSRHHHPSSSSSSSSSASTTSTTIITSSYKLPN